MTPLVQNILGVVTHLKTTTNHVESNKTEMFEAYFDRHRNILLHLGPQVGKGYPRVLLNMVGPCDCMLHYTLLSPLTSEDVNSV